MYGEQISLQGKYNDMELNIDILQRIRESRRNGSLRITIGNREQKR